MRSILKFKIKLFCENNISIDLVLTKYKTNKENTKNYVYIYIINFNATTYIQSK